MSKYLSGFGNYFESEVEAGVLPKGQNSPQKVSKNLYAEQLSGSSFTAPRKENLRTWLYKKYPSVSGSQLTKLTHSHLISATENFEPNQLRWKPFPMPAKNTNWFESLFTYVNNGSAQSQSGCGIHLYSCNQSMQDIYCVFADGELVFVPQEGTLILHTEMGVLEIEPTEIAVIPKGIKFRVEIKGAQARGYVCENYGAHFQLPDLGPIGSNGLAAPRDFLAPVAAFETSGKCLLLTKYMGQVFESELAHSPLDVMGWHGNYYPYKYDLKKFNTINTVSFDHPDPSIFTVLTSPSNTVGMANIDFVIFPPRWMVAEHTFRPPYYHRNIMSEFMGLIHGVYDAKSEAFAPGGASLHNSFAPHGPDKQTFEKASQAELKPEKIANTLAFMFESRWPFAVTNQALKAEFLDKNYRDCWK